MSCDVLSCDELSSVVKWCGAMGWDLMSLWCDVAGCDVTLCGSKWLCGVNWKMIWWSVLHRSTPYCTVLLQYYSVLHSTTPVLLCTTKYYSSTNSVLQSTTPVLLCTTKYYSSTSLYYKVLLQYYSVLQNNTKYYSSTTLYYKVLLQYYSVLQSTTPVLLCYKVLLQYYSVLQSTTPVLVWTTKYYSSTTLYYTVLLCTTKYYSTTDSVLQSTTPVLLCTLQYYSVLQSTTPVLYSLYYKVRICKARSTNVTNVTEWCACHAKWLSWLILVTYETSVTMRRATGLILQRHQILHLPRKMTLCHEWCPSHMKRHLQCAEQQVSSTNVTKYCACHEKWLASLILVTYETSFTMRGATGITLQPHQILHLPRKMILMSDVRHIYETSFTMRGATGITFQPHQILRLPRKIALQNLRKICRKQLKRQFQCAANSTMIQTRSEHDPTAKSQNWTRPFAELTFSPLGNAFCIENYNISRSGYLPSKCCTCHEKWHCKITKYCDCHEKWFSWVMSHLKRHLQCAEQQVSSSNVTKYCTCHAKWLSWVMSVTYETSFTMRGATSLTLQPHQMLRLPRKMRRMIDPRDIWNVIYNARSNRHHLPTSPNTAPATQNCTPKSKKNLPKTVEASIPMRGRFDHDPTMIRTWNCKTEPVRSQSLLFPPSETHSVLKITTFRAPAIYPDFSKCCTCHEKWHCKITKYCTCHEKWLSSVMSVTFEMSFTMRGATGLILQRHQILHLPRKMTLISDVRHIWNVLKRHLQCAEQQVSPSNLTKCCACHEKWDAWLILVTYDHLQCAEQQASPSNLTKYCACHAKLHPKI